MLLGSYKIWNLVDPEFQPKNMAASPDGLNYKTGLKVRLHKKPTIESGQLKSMEYYCHYDGSEYQDLVLRVDFEWIRDEDTKALVMRRSTTKWIFSDESGNESFGDSIKVTHKYYNARTSALADIRRRGNIVDEMLALARGFGYLNQVQTMLRSMDDALNSYKNTFDPTLISNIMSYSESFLDDDISGKLRAIGRQDVPDGLTLRMAIAGGLNYSD